MVNEADPLRGSSGGPRRPFLLADAVEEKIMHSAQEKLAQRLQKAYGEMSEELSEEVAEWDHTSKEAWRRAFSGDERNGMIRN